MYNKIQEIDYNLIRDAYDGCFFNPLVPGAIAYNPAYVVTNEDLRLSTGLFAKTARRVLTVTGSGDHPIFYKLAGATEVDTFDISFCAKAVMDIKTAVVQRLGRYEYMALLAVLHNTARALNVPYMTEILHEVPRDSAEFIRQTDGCGVFSNGLDPRSYADYLPNIDEYAQMKSKLTRPFNFIWSDVANVSAHLTEEYDVINLSNIFEWNAKLMIPALRSLQNHIKIGGYILVHTGCQLGAYKIRGEFRRAVTELKDWAEFFTSRVTRADQDQVYLLRRTR